MKRYLRIIVFISIITFVVLLLETSIIWVKLNYFQIGQGSEVITDYNEKYTMENILYKYITGLRKARVEYDEFSKVFNFKSNISKDNMIKILDVYEIEQYDYEISVIDIIKLKENQYKCEYSLEYTEEELSDGYGEVNNKRYKEPVKYINEIIVDVNYNKNAFKVLYNKFDLGGGKYYEK